MSHSILHRISFLLYPASQLVMVAVSAVWIVRLQLPEVYLRVVGLLAGNVQSLAHFHSSIA